jgi:hypothetical protein
MTLSWMHSVKQSGFDQQRNRAAQYLHLHGASPGNYEASGTGNAAGRPALWILDSVVESSRDLEPVDGGSAIRDF